MRSTFFGIEIGKTGLSYSQLGLDVTGHNIANVETAGYTRQRLIGTAYDPFATIGRALPVEQALIGGGVRVKILDQIRSAYLDRRFRTENTTNAYWGKRAESFSYVESFFDNVNEQTSINFSLARFFEAIKVLAEDTVEGAPRKLLQSSGQDMVQQLNSIYEGLMELQDSQNRAVEVTVGDINRIAKEIVELNKAIYGFEITGHIANDLRDKRNLLLDELSELVDIEYKDVPDGRGFTMLEVSIGGRKLLFHDESETLGVRLVPNEIDGEDPVWQPCWIDPITKLPLLVDDGFGNMVPDDFMPRGGELKAYMDVRDNTGVELPGIPRYIEMLNDLARALVQEINEVHRKGWTDPPVGASQTGINFFDESAAWFRENGLGDRLYATYDGQWVDEAGVVVPDPIGAGFTDEIFDLSQITAKNIRLSKDVSDSEFNIACSSVRIEKNGDSVYLQRGNNENMNDMYALFLLKDISVNGEPIGSFDGFITSIRFDVGNTLNYAKKMADTSKTLTLAAENQRTSISGVSLDEEMTSLVKYQHAYSGASRVITAMDEALDRLINGTGRVGL